MTDNHPIIPPDELVEKWRMDYIGRGHAFIDVAKEIAQWGADQELEACVNWLADPCAADMPSLAKDLRYSRRPKPQPEGGDIHYAWELHDAEGEWQAGGSAITLESVRREGSHYLQTYSQDGPHTLIIQRVSTIEEVTND